VKPQHQTTDHSKHTTKQNLQDNQQSKGKANRPKGNQLQQWTTVKMKPHKQDNKESQQASPK
jgi:hypothetical protein